MDHVDVYRKKGRYAGWPANYGIWSWGDEIVVGFTLGYHKSDGGFHRRDRDRPFETMQARSLDGGLNWTVEPMPITSPEGKGASANEHVNRSLEIDVAAALPMGRADGIDFSHPDFALMCARTGLSAGARSWFYTSTDRCRSWDGPFGLPMFGLPGIAARTDYLVDGKDTCTLFLTSAKFDGREGRVFCARTTDGGRTFEFLSWIGEEPEGFAIMPASVRLPGGRVLVAVRCRGSAEGRDGNWIDLYGSDDNAGTWRYLNRPVAETGTGGNPPAMMLLGDGRLCVVYGYRDAPSGLRAVLSEDEGETWSDPVVLRDDGGDHDVGYPRAVQRPDGRVVSAYYYDDEPDGERYIAATIW